MKIISIDTASNICGVSLLEDKRLIDSLDTDTGRTHSENLMPMIQQLLQKTNHTLKEIDLLVCDKGPGSFTGIRIGIATVKGFHDSLAIPCIGVTSLEGLAYHISTPGFICSMIDCKNDNCYFALYELQDNNYHEMIKPQAVTIKQALTLLKPYQQSTITFVGDGANLHFTSLHKWYPTSKLAPEKDHTFTSYHIGLAGLFHYQHNETEELLPLYLKKPQAERNLYGE